MIVMMFISTSTAAMSYRQLEDFINKWTLELEEQEAIFLEQATQVNAWDRLLIDNGNKVCDIVDIEPVLKCAWISPSDLLTSPVLLAGAEFRSGNGVGPILTALEPTRGETVLRR